MNISTQIRKIALLLSISIMFISRSDAQFWSATWGSLTSGTNTATNVGATSGATATITGASGAGAVATYGLNSGNWTASATQPAATTSPYIQFAVTNTSSSAENFNQIQFTFASSQTPDYGVSIWYSTSSTFASGNVDLLASTAITATGAYVLTGFNESIAAGTTVYVRVQFYFIGSGYPTGLTRFQISGSTCTTSTQTFTVGAADEYQSLTTAEAVWAVTPLCGPVVYQLMSDYNTT